MRDEYHVIIVYSITVVSNFRSLLPELRQLVPPIKPLKIVLSYTLLYEAMKPFYIQVTCNFQYWYLLAKKECQSILDYCVDLKAFVKEKSSSNSFQTLRLNEVSGI